MPISHEFDASELADLHSHGVDYTAEPAASAPEPAPTPEPAPAAAPLNPHADRSSVPSIASTTLGQPEPAAPAQAPTGEQPGAEPAPAAPTGEQPAANSPPGYVPLAALHQARAQAAETARNMQTLQNRINQILSQRAQAPAEAPLPDFKADPVEWADAMQQRTERAEAQAHMSAQDRQLAGQLEQDERLFSQYTPDYEMASQHYVNTRRAEVSMFNPPDQVDKIIVDEIRQLSRASWQRGMSPAENIYKLAQTRGYVPGLRPSAQVETPLGGAPAPAPTPAANGGAAAHVAGVAAAQTVSRTLGGAPGGAAEQANAQAILTMTDEEFAAKYLDTKAGMRAFEAIAGR